jgi:two-component system chemotaxis response regulator CheY
MKVRPRVLVVDDSMFMRTIISKILVENDMEVAGEADNGRGAVEKCRELHPDLVTMDIIMPEMGGIDAVREILAIDPGARIVMCSALGQKALVGDALNAGAVDFLVKPFNPTRVVETLAKVLDATSTSRRDN